MLRKYFIDSLLSSVPRVRGRKRIIFCIGDDSALEEDLLEALQESKFDAKWQSGASPTLFSATEMNGSVAILCTERESMDNFVLTFCDLDSVFSYEEEEVSRKLKYELFSRAWRGSMLQYYLSNLLRQCREDGIFYVQFDVGNNINVMKKLLASLASIEGDNIIWGGSGYSITSYCPVIARPIVLVKEKTLFTTCITSPEDDCSAYVPFHLISKVLEEG